MRFRGSLQLLQSEGGVVAWLERSAKVAIKDFQLFGERLTKRFFKHSAQIAESAGKKERYLERMVNKEELVQKIRDQEGVAENGLIAVLSTPEMGMAYDVFRRKDRENSELVRRQRRFKHYYFYWDDGRFGLTQVRIGSWFPFDCHVVMNGREWLARQMDRKGIDYVRKDNCFVNISDFEGAQKLADRQPRIDWIEQLNRVMRRVHPLYAEVFRDECALEYYWTAEQTEWATDVIFRDAKLLQTWYPQLLRRAIETFQSPDVLRFLGHKVPAHGGVYGLYKDDVMSDLKRREDGVRIKHRAGKNTVKMYNKQPTVLRVETTLNDGRGLKVFRTNQRDPNGKRAWLDLRKTVVDLPRRAELSQASNNRYLDAVSIMSAQATLSEITDPLGRPVKVNGRRYRALRPFDPDEVKLLQAISNGEFLICGFRNRDIRIKLYGESHDRNQQRREAGKISRKFAILRAHGLIKKIQRTHRYLLTETGVKAISAILSARQTSLSQLTAA
jgi:hypothetical protein